MKLCVYTTIIHNSEKATFLIKGWTSVMTLRSIYTNSKTKYSLEVLVGNANLVCLANKKIDQLLRISLLPLF